MSVELVGTEMLPNVYIKSIEINDHSLKHNSATVTVCILDSLELGSRSRWSNKDILLNYMDVLFVVSEEKSISDALSKSEISYNEFEIKTDDNYSPDTVQMQRRNCYSTKKFVNNGIRYFSHKFNFIFSKSSPDVSIFCANIVDTRALSHNYGLDLFDYNIKTFSGPISSEIIFSNFILKKNTNIFIKPDGTQFAGPVHSHDNKWMAGAYHTPQPHMSLMKATAFNSKIKDFRKFNFPKKKELLPFIKKRTQNYFTKLYDSFDHEHFSTTGFFGLNLFNILINETVHGGSLYNLDSTFVNQMYDQFHFKRFDIQRQKVKISSRGYKILDKEDIITSYDKNGLLNPLTKIKLNVSKDINLSNLPSSADAEVTEKNKIYYEDVKQKDIVSHIKQVFLNSDKSMRYYEFKDVKLTPNSGGEYKYILEYSFSDPSVIIVERIIRQLLDVSADLRTYFDIMSVRKHYDRDMNKITQQFKKYIADLYGTGQSAPYVTALMLFIRYKKFLYDVSQEQQEQMFDNISSKIYPEFATLKSLKSFIDDFDFLVFEVVKYFNFDISLIKDTTLPAPFKNQTNGLNIKLKHEFKNIISPSSNKINYNFLKIVANQERYASRLAPGGFPLVKMSPKQIIERIVVEEGKFDSSLSLSEIQEIWWSPNDVNEGSIKVALDRMVPLDSRAMLNDIFIRNDNNPVFVPSPSIETEPEDPSDDDVNSFGDGGLVARPIHDLKLILDTNFTSEVRDSDNPLEPVALNNNALMANISLGPNAYSSTFIETMLISEPQCEESDEAMQLAISDVISKGIIDRPWFGISTTEMFGAGSDFTNFNVKRERCPIPIENLTVAVNESLQATLMLPIRSSEMFDNSSEMSYMNNTAGIIAPMEGPESAPPQIASLFEVGGRTFDDVRLDQGHLVAEVKYFSLVGVEVFDGFETDPNIDQIKFLDKGVWRKLRQNDLNQSRAWFCRMKYYKNEQLNIEEQSKTKLPFSNKYFFITNDNINVPLADALNTDSGWQTQIIEKQMNRIRLNSGFNIDFFKGNVVNQAGAYGYTKPNDGSGGVVATTTGNMTGGSGGSGGGMSGGSSGGGTSGGGSY